MGKEKRMSVNKDIEKAKKILVEDGCTCVLVKGDSVLSSSDRGVKPLLSWLESGKEFRNYCAADKVVGKAAAFLYVLLGVKMIYSSVISIPAIEVLQKYGIEVSFEKSVEMIRNRTDTGYCPMEQSTLGISEPKEALTAVKETLKKL